jgi:gas vesicle protein
MKASTFFLGLATGTVAAAITVLYSTPKSGSEIRTSVKSASTDFKETFGDIKQKVNNKTLDFKSFKRSKRNRPWRC